MDERQINPNPRITLSPEEIERLRLPENMTEAEKREDKKNRRFLFWITVIIFGTAAFIMIVWR